MNQKNRAAIGAILHCNDEGKIRQAENNNLFDVGYLLEGRLVTTLFHGSSVERAFQNLMLLRKGERIYTQELNLMVGSEKAQTVFCSGFREIDSLVFLLSPAPEELFDLYAELIQINNQQANFIRSLSKNSKQQQQSLDNEIFDEISQLNNDLSNAQRKLAQQNRKLKALHAEKDKMLGVVAHDLRNPLGAISGYAQLLVGDGSMDKQSHELIDNIFDTSRFMLKMVEDLLDVSRIRFGKLELCRDEVDFIGMITKIVKTNRMLAERKSISLRLNAPEPQQNVLLDVNKVRQVLDNLIGNAVKFSPQGAVVIVTVSREDSLYMIQVKDEGPGIPEGEQGKLFGAFATTSVKGSAGETSTGLGLNICKNIIEAHEGKIGFESVEGAGSTFWFELPIIPAKIATPNSMGEEGKLDEKEKMIVLYVDDNTSHTVLMKNVLNSIENLRVIVSSFSLFEIEKAFQEQPRLILINADIPESRDKEALFKKISEMGDIPRIALSEDVSKYHKHSMRSRGFQVLLRRPLNVSEVRAAIHEALSRSLSEDRSRSEGKHF